MSTMTDARCLLWFYLPREPSAPAGKRLPDDSSSSQNSYEECIEMPQEHCKGRRSLVLFRESKHVTFLIYVYLL